MTDEAKQSTMAGEVLDAEFHAEIEASTFVPWLQTLSPFEEFKLHIEPDGWRVSVNDPANVMQATATLPAESFGSYEIDDAITQGIGRDTLAGAVSFARYGQRSDDVVGIAHEDFDRLSITVDRDVAGVDVVSESTIQCLDPASVRQELDDIDSYFSATAELPADAFVTIMRQFGKDDVIIEQDGNELSFRHEGDAGETTITADVDGSGESHSRFTVDYLLDIASGLSNGKYDTVTVRTADEYPIAIEAEREDQYTATYLQAPRVDR